LRPRNALCLLTGKKKKKKHLKILKIFKYANQNCAHKIIGCIKPHANHKIVKDKKHDSTHGPGFESGQGPNLLGNCLSLKPSLGLGNLN